MFSRFFCYSSFFLLFVEISSFSIWDFENAKDEYLEKSVAESKSVATLIDEHDENVKITTNRYIIFFI